MKSVLWPVLTSNVIDLYCPFGSLGYCTACNHGATVCSPTVILHIRRSKTIQFGERTHSVVLWYVPGSHLCPVSTLLGFLGGTTSYLLDAPLLASIDAAGRLVQRIQRVTAIYPQIPQCSTHSLRKGGTTWPLATVRIIGDWSSDTVFRYLLPDVPNSRFFMVRLNCYYINISHCYFTEYPLGSVCSPCTSMCLPIMQLMNYPTYFYPTFLLLLWVGDVSYDHAKLLHNVC